MKALYISGRIVLWIMLVTTILVLTRYILFKENAVSFNSLVVHGNSRQDIARRWKKANLEVFATIRLFSGKRVKTDDSYKNIGGNIVGFIPLGLLFPLLFPWLRKGWRLMPFIFLISLLFETTQLITGLGVFEVDDLLLNTAGGIIGYLCYFLLMRITTFFK